MKDRALLACIVPASGGTGQQIDCEAQPPQPFIGAGSLIHLTIGRFLPGIDHHGSSQLPENLTQVRFQKRKFPPEACCLWTWARRKEPEEPVGDKHEGPHGPDNRDLMWLSQERRLVPYAPSVSDFLASDLMRAVQRPASRLSIFLSHSMSDGSHVSVVQRQIEALGVDVYLAEHDPQPGTSIAARVERALRQSDAVVFLITTNSIDSAYVHQEVGLARAHGKPIVPLVDRRVNKARLGLLSEVEWLEIDLDDPAEALAKVTQSLQPLIRAQLVAAQTQPALVGGGADVNAGSIYIDSLVLVGIGMLIGMLIYALATSGEAGGA